MKKNPALISIGFITAVTVALTFIQPTIIHQLVIWVAGMFALLAVLTVFAISNWTTTTVMNNTVENKTPDEGSKIVNSVRALHALGWSDEAIAKYTGFDIDVIKAIP